MKKGTDQEITPSEEEVFLKTHRTSAKFVLRAISLAFLLFTYPIMSNIEYSSIEPVSSIAEMNKVWIESLYISISILISIFITYLIFKLSIRYLKYSTTSQSKTIPGYFSRKCAIVILAIIEMVSLSSLLVITNSVESGIWFASAMIGASFIVLAVMLLE